jgi:hypothetical protein
VLAGKTAPLIEAVTVCNTWMLSSLARAFRSTAGAQINAAAPPKTRRRESNAISPNTNMCFEDLGFSRISPLIALASNV